MGNTKILEAELDAKKTAFIITFTSTVSFIIAFWACYENYLARWLFSIMADVFALALVFFSIEYLRGHNNLILKLKK